MFVLTQRKSQIDPSFVLRFSLCEVILEALTGVPPAVTDPKGGPIIQNFRDVKTADKIMTIIDATAHWKHDVSKALADLVIRCIGQKPRPNFVTIVGELRTLCSIWKKQIEAESAVGDGTPSRGANRSVYSTPNPYNNTQSAFSQISSQPMTPARTPPVHTPAQSPIPYQQNHAGYRVRTVEQVHNSYSNPVTPSRGQPVRNHNHAPKFSTPQPYQTAHAVNASRQQQQQQRPYQNQYQNQNPSNSTRPTTNPYVNAHAPGASAASESPYRPLPPATQQQQQISQRNLQQQQPPQSSKFQHATTGGANAGGRPVRTSGEAFPARAAASAGPSNNKIRGAAESEIAKLTSQEREQVRQGLLLTKQDLEMMFKIRIGSGKEVEPAARKEMDDVKERLAMFEKFDKVDMRPATTASSGAGSGSGDMMVSKISIREVVDAEEAAFFEICVEENVFSILNNQIRRFVCLKCFFIPK